MRWNFSLALKLDLCRQGGKGNSHHIGGREVFGRHVGQMDSKVPDLAGFGRSAGRGKDTDSTTVAFHLKVIRIKFTIFCF